MYRAENELSRNREVDSRHWDPQLQKPKKLQELETGPISMGIWFLWVILI